MKKSPDVKVIVDARLARTNICIVSESELIVHNWSEKAKKMMLDKQMGVAVKKREAKDPDEDYESSKYYNDDGAECFPAGGFKAAIVGACRMMENLKMTKIKQAIIVEGTLVPIIGKSYMREDMVRLETGVADIRHRAAYAKWKAILPVRFVVNVISEDQLYNLVNFAGFGGIGEWRASAPNTSSGDYGRFKVVDEEAWKKYKVD